MMQLLLQRHSPIGDAVLGELFIAGTHAAYTLERVAVAIPAGTYPVELYKSPHFERWMPEICNVPDRTCILIHWGNYPFNSDGCVLVGESQDPATGDIFNTQKKFSELYPAIEQAVESEGCSITIQDALSNAEQVEDAATGEN